MNRLLRLPDILGCKKLGIPPLIPIGRAAFNKGVREGRYPQPHILGPRLRVWQSSDIQAFIADGRVR